jgi:hypothetical protein
MGTEQTKAHVGLGILVALFLLCLCPTACFGLILVGEGNSPIGDPGWPLGAVGVANLPTRVAYWEGPPFGGGQYQFLYRCRTTEELSEALNAFASIRAPRLELVLHDGPRFGYLYEQWEAPSEPEDPVHWAFTVWNPESWHRVYNIINGYRPSGQPVPAPRLDVYIGGGPITWEEVRVPAGLVVIDQRADSAPIKPVGGGLLRGDIFDICTGKPIPGAGIALVSLEEDEDRPDAICARADHLGSFQIEKIPRGRYEVVITADGYVSRQAGRYANRGTTYHELVAELAPPASIEGLVTDLEGRPIAGAEAYAREIRGIDGHEYPTPDAEPTVTDAEGRFEIHSLPIGFAQIRCRVPSMHLARSTREICEVPGKPIELTMEGTGTLLGKVVDENGNVPAGEVSVEVRPVGDVIGKWGGSIRCEADGSFEITGVPPDEYLVSSNPGLLIMGLDPDAVRVSIEAGTIVELEIVHRPRSLHPDLLETR